MKAHDFYQPGHTYTNSEHPQYGWQFRCDAVTTHPEDGERTALGWRYFNGTWDPYAYGEDDWDVHTHVGTSHSLPRQAEDPHNGPNHHDYAIGRDLPFVPRQTTGRCPQGHTFEDCTCGGVA